MAFFRSTFGLQQHAVWRSLPFKAHLNPSFFAARCSFQSYSLTGGGPFIMRPGRGGDHHSNNIDVIYDQFYDLGTGKVEIKERNYLSATGTGPVPANTSRIFASSRGYLGLVDAHHDCSLHAVKFGTSNNNTCYRHHLLPSLETLSCVEYAKRRLSRSSSSSAGDMRLHSYVINGLRSEYNMDDAASADDDTIKGIVMSADTCTAMLLFDRAVAFCKPGIDNRWLSSESGDRYGMKRYHPLHSRKDGLFYNLFDRQYTDYDCDLKKRMTRYEQGIECWDVGGKEYQKYVIDQQAGWRHKASETYLVGDDESGDLFLVYKHYSGWGKGRRIRFDIAKLENAEGQKSAESVTSIGDLVFFVGPYECFALSAKDSQGVLQPNSIYFIDNSCKFSGIYDLRDGTTKPLNEPWDKSKHSDDHLPLFWIAP